MGGDIIMPRRAHHCLGGGLMLVGQLVDEVTRWVVKKPNCHNSPPEGACNGNNGVSSASCGYVV